MDRPRRWTDNQFIMAVKNNISISGVLNDIGLRPMGGNYKTVHIHVERLGLDTSHWLGRGHGKSKGSEGHPLSSIMVNNSTYTNTWSLKRRILNEGLLENRCQVCGIDPMWQGKELVLVLDHINGNNRDHRKENLRMLCPNCNSQQSTFCRGQSKSKRPIQMRTCKECKIPITRQSRTGYCTAHKHLTK